MTGILADVNIQGHVDYLMELVTSEEWVEFWQYLGLAYATFDVVGLRPEASDAEIWQFCQDQSYVLITSNRNQSGTDSLEATIRGRGADDSIPVLTLADPERVRQDRRYAGRVVVSLLQTLPSTWTSTNSVP